MIKTMDKELEYLGEQDLFHNYIDELLQICDKELNKSQVDGGSAFSTGIDCFGFGVMIGKKIERSRHRINKNINMKQNIIARIENCNDIRKLELILHFVKTFTKE